MATRNWTNAQKAAMSASGRTLLISAAAGSGKTATLTERIIRRLTDTEHPADLSRILIVTFTRAAASELRERIAAALTEAIAKNPANTHLQKQLLSMGNAHISTIDAFCREPVKENFAALGLPAVTRIADDAELLPLCERVMGDLIDEFYLAYAKGGGEGTFSLLTNNPFADLCNALTSSKNDDNLIPTLLDLYNRLLSFPDEISRLKKEADMLRATADQDFYESDHGRVLQAWVHDFAISACQRMDQAMEVFKTDEKALSLYGEAFENDISVCRGLRDATTYAEAYVHLQSYEKMRLGTYRNAPDEIVRAKDTRTDVATSIQKLKDTYFVDSPDTVRFQMLRTAEMCDLLYTLLSTYDERISAEKRSRGITDFTDNRRMLLSLLRNPDGTPSAFADQMAARFDEVYIDEYQDVDEMQDEIFRLVGGNRRFMVGDIKQSIYGFRGADPSVFARYRRDLTSMVEEADGSFSQADSHGNSIFMSNNFRCDENIIRTTNRVCGKMFAACPDSVDYQPSDDLVFSKSKPTEDYQSPAVTVTVLTPPPRARGDEDSESDSTLSNADAEAIYVANEISTLLRGGATLADGSPIRPKDIAILMRSLTALPAYMAALTALGIPTGSEEQDVNDARRDLFHGSDMTYLCNLLRVIDNPDADIALSEVLRAPFPGLDLEELLTVRTVGDSTAESHSLYAGVEAYAADEASDPALRAKLNAFIDWLEGYRRLSTTRPAVGILRQLRHDDRCACRDTSAFLFLYESARNYKGAGFVSLYTFLRYFERKLESNAPVRADKADGDGRVSIMTIHKSKGLEFPVCFVARCGQTFSAKSQIKDLIFDKSTGVAMKLFCQKDAFGNPCHAKTDTTLRAVAGLAVKLGEREEEMRLLYVAMTRARERLYLIGVGSDKPFDYGKGDRYATLSCTSYLKWIIGGLTIDPACEFHWIPTTEVSPGVPVPRLMTTAQVVDIDPQIARYRAILDAHQDPTPLEWAVRRLPTKVPASGMRSNLLDDCVFYQTDLPPTEDGKLPSAEDAEGRCEPQSHAAIRASLGLMLKADRSEFDRLLDADRRPTAAERGTATHLFLQYCDYARVEAGGVEEEIARLESTGFLDARTAAILDRGMLTAFFKSDFFARMKTAERVERERKFSRFVPLASLTQNKELANAVGDRTLFVQGCIDLLCFYPDGSVEICDYKTDHITDAERKEPARLTERMQEAHGAQLAEYAAAVEEMYGIKPSRAYIFSLPLGEALALHI